jgi:hypothetical protein
MDRASSCRTGEPRLSIALPKLRRLDGEGTRGAGLGMSNLARNASVYSPHARMRETLRSFQLPRGKLAAPRTLPRAEDDLGSESRPTPRRRSGRTSTPPSFHPASGRPSAFRGRFIVYLLSSGLRRGRASHVHHHREIRSVENAWEQRQGVAPAAASGLGSWLVKETLDGRLTDLRRISDDIRILISLWLLLHYCFSSFHSPAIEVRARILRWTSGDFRILKSLPPHRKTGFKDAPWGSLASPSGCALARPPVLCGAIFLPA